MCLDLHERIRYTRTVHLKYCCILSKTDWHGEMVKLVHPEPDLRNEIRKHLGCFRGSMVTKITVV
jgi:hypothetical protein